MLRLRQEAVRSALWLVIGRRVFGLMTLIREITYGLDIVRPHLPQQVWQLGDVARYAPSFIESQRLGDLSTTRVSAWLATAAPRKHCPYKSPPRLAFQGWRRFCKEAPVNEQSNTHYRACNAAIIMSKEAEPLDWSKFTHVFLRTPALCRVLDSR